MFGTDFKALETGLTRSVSPLISRYMRTSLKKTSSVHRKQHNSTFKPLDQAITFLF